MITSNTETGLQETCEDLDNSYSYRVCHGFRLTKQDYYFQVNFDRFKNKCRF